MKIKLLIHIIIFSVSPVHLMAMELPSRLETGAHHSAQRIIKRQQIFNALLQKGYFENLPAEIKAHICFYLLRSYVYKRKTTKRKVQKDIRNYLLTCKRTAYSLNLNEALLSMIQKKYSCTAFDALKFLGATAARAFGIIHDTVPSFDIIDKKASRFIRREERNEAINWRIFGICAGILKKNQYIKDMLLMKAIEINDVDATKWLLEKKQTQILRVTITLIALFRKRL